MGEMTDKLHVVAVGELCPADIGGEACEGCKFNVNHPPAVLLSGCTKEAAALLFEDCRIVPAGANDEPETGILLERQAKRIKELEAEVKDKRVIKVFTVVFDIPDGEDAPTEDKVLDALLEDAKQWLPKDTVFTVNEAFMPKR